MGVISRLILLIAGLVWLGCEADVKTKSVAASISCEQNPIAPSCTSQMATGKETERNIVGMTRSTELADGYISLAESTSVNPLFTYTPPADVTATYSLPVATGSREPISCDVTRSYDQAAVPLVNSLKDQTDGIYVVCVKLVDKRGVSAYLDSYTIFLDKEAPLIQKITNASGVVPVSITPEVTERITYTWTDSTKNSYRWEKLSGAGNVTFEPESGPTATLSADAVGLYQIRFTATDPAGNPRSREFYFVKTSVEFFLAMPNVTTDLLYPITLTVRDRFGETVTGYEGEVSFSSSDPSATLPANYTFKATDKGTKSFDFTFKTPGAQTLTIKNAQEAFQQASYSFHVLPTSFLKRFGATTLAAAGYNGLGNELVIGNAIKPGKDGYFYLAGTTTGALATPNYGNVGTTDCFVAKIAVDGTLAKIYQFGTAGNDTCVGASGDVQGNVFVGGHTTGSMGTATNGGLEDVFTAKLNKDTGAVLWSMQVDGSSANASIQTKGAQISSTILWDDAMNAYEAFQTDSFVSDDVGDMGIMKVDAKGQRLLLIQVNRGDAYKTTGIDTVGGLTLDKSGNIIVGGSTEGNFAWNYDIDEKGHTTADKDVILAKYDKNGALATMTDKTTQWAIQLDQTKMTTAANANGEDAILAVTSDSEGNVYGLGYTTGNLAEAKSFTASNKNALIVKYDAGGTRLWINTLAAPDGGSIAHNEEFISAATDKNGNVYGLGRTTSAIVGSLGGAQDLFVAKYDKSGTMSWVRQLNPDFLGPGNGAGNESGGMIYVDDGGNIYIFGNTDDATTGEPGAGGQDIFMVKLNPEDGSF